MLICSNICFGMTVNLTNSDFCPLNVTIVGTIGPNQHQETIYLPAATSVSPGKAFRSLPTNMMPSPDNTFIIEWCNATNPPTCYGAGTIPGGQDITLEARDILGKGTCTIMVSTPEAGSGCTYK